LLSGIKRMRGLKEAVAAAMLMAWCASAQTTQPAQISLSAAVDLAQRNDPRVRSAQADVERAKATLTEVRDAYVPTVSLAGGYGTSTGAPLSLPIVFSVSSQSLLFNFSQRDNLRAAASGLDAANLALEEMREKVAEDVAVTYLNLENAEQREAAKKQAYGYATRLATIVNDRYEAGQDTRLDVLGAKQTAAQIHLDELHVEDEVSTLAEHLLLLIGLPGEHIETVPESIPALPDLSSPSGDEGDSYGIRSAEANAKAKQETAFGLGRYMLRPQIGFGANYSRITTSHTSYTSYYPGFKGDPADPNSDNALSVGIQIQIPLFDLGHLARAREAEAEASRARFEAADARKQFLEGRFKLRQSIAELNARIELAGITQEYAQAQLDAILAQLTATAGDPDRVQMTPKDEQNARLQERQRYVDLLNAQQEMTQVEVNLMRQTGQLDGWIKAALATPASVSPGVGKP